MDAKKVRNNHPEQSPVKAKRAEWIDEAGSNLIDLHPTIKADLQLRRRNLFPIVVHHVKGNLCSFHLNLPSGQGA